MEFVGNSIIFPAWISLIFQFYLLSVMPQKYETNGSLAVVIVALFPRVL